MPLDDHVCIGDIWESLNDDPGLCVVVEPNLAGAKEAGKDSWVMRRLIDGKTLYMHHNARVDCRTWALHTRPPRPRKSVWYWLRHPAV